MARRSTRSRIIDVALYLAIALSLFTALYFYASYQARAGRQPGLPLNWLGFGGMTALVYGYALQDHRRSWGRPRFWLTFIVALLLQAGAGIAMLWKAERVGLLVWALLTPANQAALAAYFSAVLSDAPSNHRIGGPTSA
jgi:hypothetical protein